MEEPRLKKLLKQYNKYFETQADGKLLCLANGHALPTKYETVLAFINGKKFPKIVQQYDAELSLGQFEPFIMVSKNFPKMLYCNLTGQLMAKSIEAAKKHMTGKKFILNKQRHDNGKFELKPEPNIEDLLGKLRVGKEEPEEEEEEEEGIDASVFDDKAPAGGKRGQDDEPGPSKRAKPEPKPGKHAKQEQQLDADEDEEEEEEEDEEDDGFCGNGAMIEDEEEEDGEDDGFCGNGGMIEDDEEGDETSSEADAAPLAPGSDDFVFDASEGEAADEEEEQEEAPPTKAPKKQKAAKAVAGEPVQAIKVVKAVAGKAAKAEAGQAVKPRAEKAGKTLAVKAVKAEAVKTVRDSAAVKSSTGSRKKGGKQGSAETASKPDRKRPAAASGLQDRPEGRKKKGGMQ